MIEEEFCFIIKDKVNDTINSIKMMSKLGDFVLVPQSPITICDVYMDTVDRFLKKNNNVLRVRFENEKKLITYKKQISPTKKEEREFPYDVIKMIKLRGKLNVRDKVLICVHERQTIRCPIKVMYNKTYIASMSIDRVTYDKSRTIEDVIFDEIEVENKSTAKYHHLFIGFVELLKKSFKLIEWKHSKTATCDTIGDLHTDSEFKKTIKKDGLLTYSGFKIIDKVLNDNL